MPWSLNGSEAGGGPYFVTNHHVHGLASIRITRFALENSKHLKIRPYFVTNHHVHGLASIRITRFALENSKHLKIRGKQLILFSREMFQRFSRRSRGKH